MSDGEPGDESIGALFLRLRDDAEHLVRAEIGLWRAQLLDRVRQARAALIYGVIALMLAHVALFALVVGLLLVIARSLGPRWATVIVAGGLLAVAALCGWLAASSIKRVTRTKDKGHE